MNQTSLLFGARLIAHRGLHDARKGLVENSLPAFEAAAARGFAIETDVRSAQGGEPVIFHDEDLERLTDLAGKVTDRSASDVTGARLRGSESTVPHLSELLDAVRGRVPIFLEIKSGWPSSAQFLERTARHVRNYSGPIAVMSFDPVALADFRRLAPAVPLGLGVTRWKGEDRPSPGGRGGFGLLPSRASLIARPDFLSIDKKVARCGDVLSWSRSARYPVAIWTATNYLETRRLLRQAAAVIFEGFHPDPAMRML